MSPKRSYTKRNFRLFGVRQQYRSWPRLSPRRYDPTAHHLPVQAKEFSTHSLQAPRGARGSHARCGACRSTVGYQGPRGRWQRSNQISLILCRLNCSNPYRRFTDTAVMKLLTRAILRDRQRSRKPAGAMATPPPDRPQMVYTQDEQPKAPHSRSRRSSQTQVP
jgi:hypothetical protein